jgi:hypothetical protein
MLPEVIELGLAFTVVVVPACVTVTMALAGLVGAM